MSDIASAAPAAAAPATPAAPVATAPLADAKPTTPASDKATEAKTDAPAAPQESAAAAAARRYKVKVDEAEQEVDEAELLRGYQTAKAADKRFREASDAKKAAEAQKAEINNVLKMAMENPLEFSRRLEKMGVKTAEMAEAILRPLIEAQMEADAEKEMTPEQLENHKARKELEQYKAKEAEAKKAAELEAKKAQDAAKSAAVDRAANEQAELIKIALAETKLPHTYETAMEVVAVLRDALERGVPVDAKTVVRDLEARRREELSKVATADLIPEEVRRAIMREAAKDPEIRELIRKETVEEFKKSNPMAAAKPVTGPATEKTNAQPKKTNFGSITRDLMRQGMRKA